MHALRAARTHTVLSRTLTHTQARRWITLRDIQLQRRKKLQQENLQKEEHAEQPVSYPPPPRTTHDIAREKRKQLQDSAKQPPPAADSQKYAVQGFDYKAVNTGSVDIPNLDVVQSGSTNEYKWSIQGHENQIVEIDIYPGQSVVAETGAMLEMSNGVEMETKARGGLMQSVKRMFTGQGLFLSEFTYNPRASGLGRTVFSSPYPSKILALDLAQLGGALICQKNAFLVGSKSVEIELAYTKNLTSGFFGGEGFILQQLHGDGLAFVHAGGAVIKRILAPGETIRVSTGSLVAFQPSVDYDVQMVPGFKNMIFGGEGIFLATLTGPGLVILQSLPFDRLVGAISSRMPSRGGHGSGVLPIPFIGGGASGSQVDQRSQQSAVGAPAAGGGSGLGGALAGGLAGGMAAGAVGSMLGGHGGYGGSEAAGDAGAAAAGDVAGDQQYGTPEEGGAYEGDQSMQDDNPWGTDDGGDFGDDGGGDFGGDE